MTSKYLIVMPDKHLGNFVIALNAIKPLRDRYGDENVAVIFDEAHRDIVETNLGLKNIFFYPRKQLESTSSFLKRCAIYMNFVQKICHFKPTISVALEACNVSAMLSYFSGAKRRIGLDANKIPFLLNEKIPFRKHVHRVESYRDVINKIDPNLMKMGLGTEALVKTTIPTILLMASDADQKTVDKILAEKNIVSTKPLICIHTGAGKPHKQWPIQNFAKLVSMLVNDYQVALIGGPAERAQNNVVLEACAGKVIDLTCCLSVAQLIALFKKTTLLISNDSGPMHIAALSGTAVIALFGPTDEIVWGPLSEKTLVLTGSMTCKNNCKEKFQEKVERCFCSLDVDTVLNATRKLLPVGS